MLIRYILLLASFVLFVACTPDEETSPLRLEQTEDYLRIYHNDKPVLNYWMSTQLPDGLDPHYTRSGFIHPVYSPAGRVVTDDFPAGYAHQHGLFTAWTKTFYQDTFVDFWNTHKELATVEHLELLEVQDQPPFLGFRARLQQRSFAFGAILREDWTVRVHDRGDVFVWDLRSVQTNITDDTLVLAKHLYGGLGIRGSKHWNAADSLHYLGPAGFLTSEGLTRDSANHTRPEWTAIWGDLPSGRSGMVVLPHPDNFRWPQAVRVHPSLPYFSVSPVTTEGFTIAPGETYVMRYRMIVFDEEPDAKIIDEVKW